ncbi:MAG TPA: hypothetical protein VN222_16215 [Novosphingobium sp.]|nr:hypothetical protein [Novosphingobium sp.]
MLHRIVAAISPGWGLRTALTGAWASLWGALAGLSGCQPQGQQAAPPERAVVATQATERPMGVAVACALGGAPWSESCVLERQGAALVVSHPSGAFLRLDHTLGYWRADGADRVVLHAAGGLGTQLQVGANRLRLPSVEVSDAASP